MTTPLVISVVDDDAPTRRAIRNFLQARGYVVDTFETAGEFLASPNLNDTSCVIADVQMPVMNGLELQAQVSMLGYAAPFIFITGCSDESFRARALNAGAICFLTKPFAAPSLIACLDVALVSGVGTR
jgi:FixJ family two-component response regulator